MLNILAIVGAVLVVLVIAVLVMAMLKPNTLSVQRSTQIAAPAEKIFPLVDDFHRWTSWSPYEKRDPELKRTYSGAPKGKGAVYEWNGNSNVGSGRMEILESKAPGKIAIDLQFFTPFKGHNLAEFLFVPQGSATQVTWQMNGPATFMTKLMALFINFDKMIGKDFEDGLATMKTLAEK